ncbi:hypothetical protein [Microtetraspora malaysiensis]|uniref:hypothetical protein n=1 Tax=Microtetraspora malaysiensis TaxID=161358 RepID=UPI003D923E1E
MAPLQATHEKLAWRAPTARAARVRVRLHTCECKATLYELCQGGGLMFVRWTVRRADGHVVRETEWLRAALMERLWQRILLGEAR